MSSRKKRFDPNTATSESTTVGQKTERKPDGSKSPTLESTPADVHRDTAPLDDASEHLGAAQEGICLRRDALRECSDEHIGFPSPIRRVPPEILAEIFIHFLPNDFLERMVPSKYLKGWRMVPSHVCKRWRDLSLSTPIHWAYVSAEVKGVDEEKISRELECAQAWLARSGSCPLTIKVAYNGNQPAHWKRLMDFFLPCCDRWRHAKIFSSSKMPADLSSIKDKLPLLEALTLELPQPPKGAPFGNAPKLRQLKITLCDDERDDERDEGPGAVFVFPWSQLTHVKLRFLTEQECWWIMQKLHNVVSLAVGQFAAWGDPPQPHYQMLRLEHLKRLTFQWFKTNSGFAGFHEHLDVPSMTNYCYHDRLGATWSLPSFQSLLSRRSSCRLVSVSLILHTMEIDDLPLVLQCIPDVSHFDFNGHSMYVNQVQTLLTASPFLLPRLEHLTLHHDMYFNPHLLLAMIESRMVDYGCTRLRKVTISEFYDWRVLDEEVCERLEQLALTVRRETFQMSVSLHGTADGFRSEGWTSYGDAI